jgi:hypothetical protein
MHRASNAFSVLQATAAIVGMAILLWSLGLPSFHFAEAANVTSFSDTLSDSAPSVGSNHTISFKSPTGVTNGQTVTITFPTGFTGTSSLVAADFDVATTSNLTVASNCAGTEKVSAAFTGLTLTLTFCSGDGGSIPSNATTTIKIGTNATFGGSGTHKIVNPTVASYPISMTAGPSDAGNTRVAIVNNVLVTARVDTLFTFTVAGTPGGTVVNTADTTGATTTAQTIPFGTINANTASTAAQRLSVTTNARGGFVVTVTAGSQLVSSNGADIDGFKDGAYTSTPTAWAAPSATLGSENTYGHWGITTDDATTTAGQTNPFNVHGGGNRYVSASTTPVEVFRNYGPANGVGQGVGTTVVGYKIERSALQEAADDYQATLTYVATPVF